MKILYIYREFYNRRKRYGQILEQLGHSVRMFHADRLLPNKYLNDIDLIWVYKPQLIKRVLNKKHIKTIKRRGIRIATYGAAQGNPMKTQAKLCKHIDFVFIYNKHFVNKLSNKKFIYMPLGFYKEDYFPCSKTKNIDVSFMGGLKVSGEKDARVIYLKRLLQHFNVGVYGEKLCNVLNLETKPYTTHEEQRQTYWRTKVNIGLPFTTKSYDRIMHQKNRFFEIPASGEILLTHYLDEFAELFTPDKEVFYYSSIEELIDKTKYILHNYDKLQKVREAACQRAVKEHQYIHRFKKMMEIISE